MHNLKEIKGTILDKVGSSAGKALSEFSNINLKIFKGCFLRLVRFKFL